jgi:hypothetical protein
MKFVAAYGVGLSLLLAFGSFLVGIIGHLSNQQGAYLMVGLAAVMALASIAASLLVIATR